VTSIVTSVSVSKDEFGDFMAVFPELVRDLTDTSLKLNVPDATEWLENVCADGFVLQAATIFICMYNIYIYIHLCSVLL